MTSCSRRTSDVRLSCERTFGSSLCTRTHVQDVEYIYSKYWSVIELSLSTPSSCTLYFMYFKYSFTLFQNKFFLNFCFIPILLCNFVIMQYKIVLWCHFDLWPQILNQFTQNVKKFPPGVPEVNKVFIFPLVYSRPLRFIWWPPGGPRPPGREPQDQNT